MPVYLSSRRACETTVVQGGIQSERAKKGVGCRKAGPWATLARVLSLNGCIAVNGRSLVEFPQALFRISDSPRSTSAHLKLTHSSQLVRRNQHGQPRRALLHPHLPPLLFPFPRPLNTRPLPDEHAHGDPRRQLVARSRAVERRGKWRVCLAPDDGGYPAGRRVYLSQCFPRELRRDDQALRGDTGCHVSSSLSPIQSLSVA